MSSLTMAVCIPTYERRDIVEDFLNNCYDAYTAAGIDLYFYDSSIGDETQSLIQDWLPKGRLYYVRMPSDMHPNTKAYRIFQGYGLEKAYDFVLLSSDALQYSSEGIQKIMQSLSLAFDMISIECSNKKEDASRVFTNRDEYMVCCVYHLATFGRVVLNTHTMTNNVDWKQYEARYLSEPFIPWSHVSFYLNRIAEINDFKGIDLVLPDKAFRLSKRKKSPCWSKTFLPTLCEGWVQTMETLPSCYVHINEAIREQGERDLPDHFSFLQLKRYGLLSIKDFNKYKVGLKKITPVPLNKLFLLSCLPQRGLNAFYSLRRKREVSVLRRFCKKHRQIWIYGTGMLGELFGRFLSDIGIKYTGFCVSHNTSPAALLCGHPVCQFSQLIDKRKEIGIVVAMYARNATEVLDSISASTVSKVDVFYSMLLNNEIMHQYNYFFLRP